MVARSVSSQQAAQVSDYTGAAAMPDELSKAKWLPTDRVYDADWYRDALQAKWITPCILGRKSRNTEGNCGKLRYKQRNWVEVMFGRVATRNDKCPMAFFSEITLAATHEVVNGALPFGGLQIATLHVISCGPRGNLQVRKPSMCKFGLVGRIFVLPLLLCVLAAQAVVPVGAQSPPSEYCLPSPLAPVLCRSRMTQTMPTWPIPLMRRSTKLPIFTTRAEGEKPAIYVLELPEQTELEGISFDTGGMTNAEKSVKGVTVEVSDTSATAGFSAAFAAELQIDRNDQNFILPQKAVGRWVRLIFTSKYGAENYGVTGFHGYGRRLTDTAHVDNVSGIYEGANGWGTCILSRKEAG